MKISTLLLLIVVSLPLQAQDITNTIATDGFFYVKDASTTFLTLGQANGYLELSKSLKLPHTTAEDVGVIYKGADRFTPYMTISNLDLAAGTGVIGTSKNLFKKHYIEVSDITRVFIIVLTHCCPVIS